MILYKYLPAERIDVLRNAMIRFTQPAALNDPFDCNPRMLDVDEVENAPRSEYPCCRQAHISGLQMALSQNDRRSVGLICLAETPDDLLMWAHYADEHRGLVLGFDTSHSFFAKGSEGTGLWKVTYSGVRPSFPKKIVEMELLRQPTINPHGLINAYAVGDDAFDPDIYDDDYRFVKSAAWAYEREWRVLRKLQNPDGVIDNGANLPIYLYRFPRSVVQSVILGFRGYSKLYPLVRDVIADYPEYNQVRIFRAMQDSNEFKVVIDFAHPLPRDASPSGDGELALESAGVMMPIEEAEALSMSNHSPATQVHGGHRCQYPVASIVDDAGEQEQVTSRNEAFEQVLKHLVDSLKSADRRWLPRSLLKKATRKLSVLRAASRKDPTNAELHYQLGLELRLVGRSTEAEESFQSALRYDRTNSEIWFSLGDLYMQLNESERAEDAFRSALELDPNSSQAITNIGALIMLQNRFDEAAALFRRAIVLEPDLLEAHLNLGWALMNLREFSSAVDEFVLAIQVQPQETFMAYVYLGHLLSRLGDAPIKASILLELTNKLESAQPINRLVLVLRTQGFTKEVVPLLNKEISLLPDDPQPRLDLAGVCKKLGNRDQVEECLEQARKRLLPDDWYGLACIAVIAGDNELALHNLSKVQSVKDRRSASVDPNFEELRNDTRFLQYAEFDDNQNDALSDPNSN